MDARWNVQFLGERPVRFHPRVVRQDARILEADLGHHGKTPLRMKRTQFVEAQAVVSFKLRVGRWNEPPRSRL